MICGGGNVMKFRWLIVFALGVAVAKPASSQVSAYADWSVTKLTGGLGTTSTNYLTGPTIGLTAHLAGSKHLILSGDIRGGFYGKTVKLDQVAIGPKLALAFKKYQAYGELMVGFARYNDGLGHAASGSTDAQAEINFGLDRNFAGRWGWRIFDYGYEQYYGLGGEFNPKTFSTGLIFHLSK
jgi:hypothetical protein